MYLTQTIDAPPAADQTPALVRSLHKGVPFETVVHDELLGAEAAIEIQNFDLYYDYWSRALWQVNMRVPEKKVTALIGPSGCGKSTLLRSINRLNDLIAGVRTEGDMRLHGRSVYAPDVDVIDLRKRIGMVFQKSNPFPMSIFENVIYALRLDGVRSRKILREACEASLKQAALFDEVKDRLDESALSLSGGQQQRLCIARAIAARPEVLLMDEPCSALDPIATLRIEEFIRDMRDKLTIVIVTHNMQQARRVSDYTAFMYLGRLVEYGPTNAVFSRPRLPETRQYVGGQFG